MTAQENTGHLFFMGELCQVIPWLMGGNGGFGNAIFFAVTEQGMHGIALVFTTSIAVFDERFQIGGVLVVHREECGTLHAKGVHCSAQHQSFDHSFIAGSAIDAFHEVKYRIEISFLPLRDNALHSALSNALDSGQPKSYGAVFINIEKGIGFIHIWTQYWNFIFLAVLNEKGDLLQIR